MANKITINGTEYALQDDLDVGGLQFLAQQLAGRRYLSDEWQDGDSPATGLVNLPMADADHQVVVVLNHGAVFVIESKPTQGFPVF